MASSLIACLHTGGTDHLLQYLNLEGCICLACSCKAAHALLGLHLSTGTKRSATRLLVDRMQRSAQYDISSTFKESDAALQHNSALHQQVLWLVQQAGSMQQILPGRSDIDACMKIHSIPLSAAVALTQHGFRFTYEQLCSMAQQQVQGLEVWMQAYRVLGIARPHGMPAIGEALCCNDKWAWPSAAETDYTPQQLLDVLQLAVAMPAVGTATNILQDVCTSGAADHLSPATLNQLLKAAVKSGHSPRVEILLKLPSALDIPTDSLLHLLHSAVAAKLTYSLHLLCKLPAVQLIHVETLLDLLQYAIQIQDPGAVRVLCSLPAVACLGPDVASCLMQSVLHSSTGLSEAGQQPCGMVWVLSQLPAALAQPGAVGAF